MLPVAKLDPKKLDPDGFYILKIHERLWVVKLNVSKTGFINQNQPIHGTTVFFKDIKEAQVCGPFYLNDGENT